MNGGFSALNDYQRQEYRPSNPAKMPQVLSEEGYSTDQGRCCDESISFGKRRVIRFQTRVLIRDGLVNPNKTKPTEKG